jgi:hypothetical protein
MKAATNGSRPDWIEQPAGVERIRRCRESGGLATEYCELHGTVDSDFVSFGRTPDLCQIHSSLTLVPAPTSTTSAISYSIRPPR